MSDYKRIIIKGTLTTLDELHIGTGDEETHQIENETVTFNCLTQDATGKPMIPASSLRGYLRDMITTHQDETSSDKLFGKPRQRADADDTGNAGRVRMYDARWLDTSSGEGKQKIITKTSIDPLTGTAKDKYLFSHALVPVNSRFEVFIEMDKVNEAELKMLLKALNTLGESYQGKLGKGKNSGQGRLKWEKTEIKGLDQTQFIKWLNADSKKGKNLVSSSQISNLQHFFKAITLHISDSFTPFKQQINYHLSADGPLLIVDGLYSRMESTRRKNQNRDNKKTLANESLFEADLFFMRQGNNAIIPGSTLKGWVRGRCRKILLTLAIQKSEETGERILSQQAFNTLNDNIDTELSGLFGHNDQQGLLNFSNATIAQGQYDIHQQTFNAIDRFSGGVKDTALFNVEAIWPKEPIPARIEYYQDKLKGWMKLLLLFVLRDASEDDLVLGWGKSRGYGRLKVKSDQYSDLKSILGAIEIENLEAWQKDLNAEIAEIVHVASQTDIETEDPQDTNEEATA